MRKFLILFMLSGIFGASYWLSESSEENPVLTHTAKNGHNNHSSTETSATIPKPRPEVTREPNSKKLDPLQVEIDALLKDQDWLGVLDKLEQILVKKPNEAWVLEMAGMIYLDNLKQPEKALPYLKKAATSAPNQDRSLKTIIQIGYNQQKPEEALQFLDQLNQRQPGHPAVQHHLGKLFFEKGDTESSLSHLIESKRDPRYYEQNLDLLGEAYRKLGRKSEAEAHYREAIKHYESKRDESTDRDDSRYYDRTIARQQLRIAELYVNIAPQKAESLVEEAEKILGTDSSRVRFVRKQLQRESL